MNKARGLLRLMRRCSVVAFICLLNDVALPLKILSLKLQAATCSVAEIPAAVVSTLLALESLKDKYVKQTVSLNDYFFIVFFVVDSHLLKGHVAVSIVFVSSFSTESFALAIFQVFHLTKISLCCYGKLA